MNKKVINIIKEEPFVGIDGLNYIKVTKEILTPRKTYLKGTISGKYRGDKIPNDYDRSDLYDFTIYEADVQCNSIDDFSKNKPFIFPYDFKNIDDYKKIKGTVFPKEKLPPTLPIIITANNKTFGINILEPQLFEFTINHKHHQIEGNEIFGEFNAYITGYVFDYEREEVEEINGPIIGPPPPPPPPDVRLCESNGIKTGEVDNKSGYVRYEYFCKHHPDKVWGPWIREGGGGNNGDDGKGCVSEIIGGVGILLFIAFLIAVFPGILYFLGFFIAIFIIGLLAPYLKWIFRGLGFFLIIMFISSLFNAFNHSSTRHNPPLVVQDTQEEQLETRTPIVDDYTPETENNIVKDDFIVKKYRIWNDYDGNTYEGYYTIRLTDVNQAHSFKNNLSIKPSNIDIYDEIVFNLKQNDKNKLNGVYKMFDSIQSKNQLSNIKFAEMMVSFVQDIPYVLILEDDCNPNLYNDSSTRKYLSSPNAKCSGYQRFGINTPIEFLYTLNGDCDTRTLLLYTMLSHYNYDVALLSSELYQHSILGVNILVNGLAYKYQNQKYVLWETTTPGIKPGLISNEISNTNNWRISLKSK
jgi:membrane protein implicated in regulation of membrane protease activity